MITGCPSDLALERLLLGRANPSVERHAQTCPGCAARLAAMRREGEEFRRAVFPATVERVEAAAAGAPRRRWLMALLPAPLLAAAAVALVLVPRAPPPDYLGVKGGEGIGLALFAPGTEGPRLLADGAEVAPGTALRFRLRAGEACRLFLLSVDGAGVVSRLDGGGAEGLALAAGQHDLPGGARLDGAEGPERFYAVCAPQGTGAAAVEQAAREAGAGGATAVRQGKVLGGLPAGTAQATHLLEKRP